MLKRTLIVLFLMTSLVLAIQPGQLVHGGAITSPELATLTSTDTPDTTDEKKSGNGLVRVLKSPFTALGRLFGGKKNDNKLQRISRKDLKGFENVPARAVTDARTTIEKTAKNGERVTVVTAGSEYPVHLQKGRDLLNAGDLNGAIAELSLAASLDAKSGEARNLLGIAYESKGMRARALESLKAAVQADKNNAEYLNNYGFLLYKNNDFDDATKYLKRAAKISPDDARIWNNLGLAQSHRGKFDDAFQSFTRAVGAFNGHMNVAAQLLQQGFAKDAIKHLEQAQTLQPDSVDVLVTLANLYEKTGRASDAATARRSLVALRTFAGANK
jgi:Flp pilus assembly protein TadD